MWHWMQSVFRSVEAHGSQAQWNGGPDRSRQYQPHNGQHGDEQEQQPLPLHLHYQFHTGDVHRFASITSFLSRVVSLSCNKLFKVSQKTPRVL